MIQFKGLRLTVVLREKEERGFGNISDTKGYLEAYLEEHVLWKKLILSKIPYSHTACMSLM
ncbi:MAG: hypothetical protein QXO76_09110 [Thermoproteota archaeon]